MSSLLKDAIVDAKALRESALKTAETSIIEKYSEEVKQTLDQLLEQDELGLDTDPTQVNDSEEVAKNIPLAATDNLSEESGEIPEDMNTEGEEIPVTIDLDALQEAVKAIENEISEDEEIELTEEELASILSGEVEESVTHSDKDLEEDVIEEDDDVKGEDGEDPVEAQSDADKASGFGGTNENLDSLVDAIAEKLTVDMGANLAGWAGRSSDNMKFEIEKELAHRRSTDVEEEMETLKKAQEELVFENKQLNEHLSQHKQAFQELKESLQDVNLSNARLLYTNRVLRNTSLNERQKEKIVEAISNAGSVTEAKVICETLQNTVETKPKRSPQSLSEAISNKRSSVIRATRKESTPSDPLQERMKRLAGIK